ncbi:MAG: hypothetical protein ACT4NY_29605 [Pseudonocardiales bacterium]
MQGKELTTPEEPTMLAEAAQAVDPVLVRRLWRPVERPGVIDPGPARAMLTRHQRMVAGLPLAELVSRHTGAISDLDGAAVPIVYALPSQPPPFPASRLSDAHLNAAVSSPIVSARPAPVAGPVQPVQPVQPSPVQSSPVQAAPGSLLPPSALPVVSVTYDAATSLVVQPPSVSDPRSVDQLPFELHTPDPRSSDPRSPDTRIAPTGRVQPALRDEMRPTAAHDRSAVAEFDTSVVRVASSSSGVELGDSRASRGQATGPVQAVSGSSHLPSVSPTVVATDKAAVSLVVQPKVAAPLRLGSPSPGSPRNGPGPVARRPLFSDSRSVDRLPLDLRIFGHRPPDARVTAPGPADPEPVDHGLQRPGTPARPAVGAAVHPHVRAEQPLLLVDLEAVTARPARNRAVTAEHREAPTGRTSGPGHVQGAGQAVGALPHADHAAQTQAQARRQATAPVDVERIVDAVHRRFVRRLAIEAERRAVR